MHNPFQTSAQRIEQGLRSVTRLAGTAWVVNPKIARWLIERRRPTPVELKELCEKLGASYIKLGQFIASSPSLFPPDYVAAFESCLDKTPAIRFSVIKRTIEKDLRLPVSEVFASIDPEPIASASIAQVHAAQLLTGEDVVIKVQKPGLEAIFGTDMTVVFLATRLVEILNPLMQKDMVSGIARELHETMLTECDFLREAENIREFREFLMQEGIQDICVPKVYKEASGMRVLTMERFRGQSLKNADVLKKRGQEHLLLIALQTWMRSLQANDFFHADLHSGNMMVLDNGKIGFIDWGMVGRIAPDVWRAAGDLLMGISASDAALIADAMCRVGVTKKKVNKDRLEADIRTLQSRVTQLFDLSNLNQSQTGNDANKLVFELAMLGRRHGIRFPRAFVLLLKQLMYFDRFARQLTESFSFIEAGFGPEASLSLDRLSL